LSLIAEISVASAFKAFDIDILQFEILASLNLIISATNQPIENMGLYYKSNMAIKIELFGTGFIESNGVKIKSFC